MYTGLMILFGITAVLSVAGMFLYKFNIIFLYILLFSAVLVLWLFLARREENKEKSDGA